jgi:hypothetical protein
MSNITQNIIIYNLFLLHYHSNANKPLTPPASNASSTTTVGAHTTHVPHPPHAEHSE